jgi:hypothetical protein
MERRKSLAVSGTVSSSQTSVGEPVATSLFWGSMEQPFYFPVLFHTELLVGLLTFADRFSRANGRANCAPPVNYGRYQWPTQNILARQ